MTATTGRTAATIAVVGGGIAGLAAAVRLRDRLGPSRGLDPSRGPGARIVIIEGTGRLGGKLCTGELADGPTETGAEAFVMRAEGGRPSPAADLVHRLGLGDLLRHPRTTRAALAIDGGLHPIPTGTLMGIPADPAAVAGVARVVPGLDTAAGEPLLGPDADVAVGELVRRRLGDQVVDRLVDPLLGGVYAGRADQLSLAVTVPDLARACRSETTLAGAVRAVLRARSAVPTGTVPTGTAPPDPTGTAPPDPTGTVPPGLAAAPAPVFGTLEGGLSRLVEAAAAASGAELRLGAPVRELRRTPGGWALLVGPNGGEELIEADAVVLALPARPAARLLAPVSPDAAGYVGALDYASVALVALALPATDLPDLSGFLVPADQGYRIKAMTNFGAKWAHQTRPDGLTVVRASVGRYGDERELQRDDDELATLVHEELSRLLSPALGRPLPAPVRTRVNRWGGSLPQYRPGHTDRVAAARLALAAANPGPGNRVALAGAGYDGVGIAACVRSGSAAADRIIDALAGLTV
jgi:oxygen-dependent protoporphyrinogen oxidase